MKKMSFPLLGLPLLLGSCAAAVSNGSADDVRVGMTEAQVRHLLGAPLARTVTPDSARWHYQWGADWHNRRRRLELSFRDGRVVNFLLNEELAVRPYAAGSSGALSSQVDDDDFLDLLLSVRAAATDINRLDVLGHALTNRRLSGRQGRALLRQFSFDSDRLKALSLIAPCLEGSYDRDLLLDTFTFSGYVSSARQLLDARRR